MLSPKPRTKSHPSRWHTLRMACATWVCSMPPSPISPSATNVTACRSGSRGCSREKSTWVAIGCKHPLAKNNTRKHSTAQEKPDAFTVVPMWQVGLKLEPYNDTSTNMLSNTKIYGRVKNRFPWSLVTVKPQFYVRKFGRRTQVTL